MTRVPAPARKIVAALVILTAFAAVVYAADSATGAKPKPASTDTKAKPATTPPATTSAPAPASTSSPATTAKPAPTTTGTSAPAVDSHGHPVGSHPAPATTPVPGAQAAEKPKPAVVDSLGLLERAVAKEDSTKFDNLYRLGVMYLDRDRVNESIRVLEKAHKLKPKNNKVLVNLGAAYDAAGQPAIAQNYYKDALKLAPTDSVANCRLASSYYAQGNYKDAMTLLRSMINDGKGSYCAYFTMGVAFADAGIYRDAIRMWQKVVELAPNTPEANSAKESIEVLQKFVK